MVSQKTSEEIKYPVWENYKQVPQGSVIQGYVTIYCWSEQRNGWEMLIGSLGEWYTSPHLVPYCEDSHPYMVSSDVAVISEEMSKYWKFPKIGYVVNKGEDYLVWSKEQWFPKKFNSDGPIMYYDLNYNPIVIPINEEKKS